MNTQSPRKKLYLQDLSVGDEFPGGSYHLDERQIIAFASQFDPQPFHTDERAAATSFFHGLAASGWHTTAITMKLLVESLPFARGIIGVSADLSWPQPTRPGDILRVKSTVTEVKQSRSKPDRGIVTVETLTLNQNDEVRQKLVSRLLAFTGED